MVYFLLDCRFIDTVHVQSVTAVALFSGTQHNINKWHSYKYSWTWWANCGH